MKYRFYRAGLHLIVLITHFKHFQFHIEGILREFKGL